MKGNRDEVFAYIFSKADEVGYMGLDSARSSKFQDELERDPELIKIAGGKLSRNYIKDTVLNNYSKKQRYISEDDVLSVFEESHDISVLATKKDLENGSFRISYFGNEFECTSSSINEWQTVLKRFGKRRSDETRFAFLTCGGVEKEKDELASVIDILSSYDVTALIVKPSQKPISIQTYVKNKSVQPVSLVKVNLSKPFLLLAGISGTGKTRFVREQAKASGQFAETYCLTSVRPDWHEPSDLLGYISRLNGSAEYITTDILQFISKAWRAIADSELVVEVTNVEGLGKRLVVTGKRGSLGHVLPYWLCLDEMNLAPVEQYFADYLSVLETREWIWKDNDSFTYNSDALLKPSTIKKVADREQLRKELGFGSVEDGQYNELWELICQFGLGIPCNLLVVGTVNMDETTHGFSRKVIDRALTFDFGEFFPNDLDDFFEARNEVKIFSFPTLSQAKKGMFANVPADTNVEKTRTFFEAINEVLKGTPFELAFRAFNELCLSVCSFAPKDDAELQAVFDDFLMCKVLPRIEGDEDKLQGQAQIEGQNILEQLTIVLARELNEIWESQRVDLMRKQIGSEQPIQIACRSRKKIDRMSTLLTNGFTSFWP